MTKPDAYFLRNILKGISAYAEALPFSSSDDLYSARILDSYSTIQLISELEDKLEIIFDFNDLQRKNLVSIEAIVNLLRLSYDRSLPLQE